MSPPDKTPPIRTALPNTTDLYVQNVERLCHSDPDSVPTADMKIRVPAKSGRNSESYSQGMKVGTISVPTYDDNRHIGRGLEYFTIKHTISLLI